MANFNQPNAEWDQRRAYQQRLDNYTRNVSISLTTSDFTTAFSQCRIIQSEIIGWIKKLNKKTSIADITKIEQKCKSAKKSLFYYNSNNIPNFIIYEKIHNYFDTLNEMSHKYGLVMSEKSGYGGVGDV